MAFVFKDFIGPGYDMRVIGMEVDNNGILKVISEMNYPPNTIPSPDNTSKYLTKGYFQQQFYVKGCNILLKGPLTDTVVLNLKDDDWINKVSLQIGCLEDTL